MAEDAVAVLFRFLSHLDVFYADIIAFAFRAYHFSTSFLLPLRFSQGTVYYDITAALRRIARAISYYIICAETTQGEMQMDKVKEFAMLFNQLDDAKAQCFLARLRQLVIEQESCTDSQESADKTNQ